MSDCQCEYCQIPISSLYPEYQLLAQAKGMHYIRDAGLLFRAYSFPVPERKMALSHIVTFPDARAATR